MTTGIFEMAKYKRCNLYPMGIMIPDPPDGGVQKLILSNVNSNTILVQTKYILPPYVETYQFLQE